MSGGSFNYLCFKEDLGQLAEGREQIVEMEEYLRAYGTKASADATAQILTILNAAQADVDRILKEQKLVDVWQAVEWLCSCDWGPGHLRVRLDAFHKASE